MSSGWSIFVVVLTIANILACVWLLRWTTKPKHAGEKIGGGSDTGHTWDGDLREYNNPLPKWWLWLFYITVAFGLIYLALFPGLGTFGGLKGWSQAGQYEQERAAAEARAAELLAPFATMTVPELAGNAQAMATAQQPVPEQLRPVPRLGRRRRPRLPEPDQRRLAVGRRPGHRSCRRSPAAALAAMTPWGEMLGEQGVEPVVAYVQQLSGQPADAAHGRGRRDALPDLLHGLPRRRTARA